MTQNGGAARQVTEALADATGRTDEEVRLALTLAAVAATVGVALRFVRFLADLGTDVLRRFGL